MTYTKSFSQWFLRTKLRREVKFRGFIISYTYCSSFLVWSGRVLQCTKPKSISKIASKSWRWCWKLTFLNLKIKVSLKTSTTWIPHFTITTSLTWIRFNRSLQPCRLLQFGFFSWANSQLSCSMVLGDEFGSWPAAADLILCDVAASLASPLVRLSWVLNSGHPKHSSLSVWNFIQLCCDTRQ